MTRPRLDECGDCEVTATDISREGVDPDFWFERGGDGVMRCRGCEAIQSANRRFEAGDW